MARCACLCSNVFGARDTWRCDDATIRFKRAARKQDYGERDCPPDCPQQFFAFTVQPSNWPRESHVPDLLPEIEGRDYAFFRKKRNVLSVSMAKLMLLALL